MTDTVNIGTGPNSHNGDLLRTAFANINTAIAACQAASPITVSGLNALGLSASTVNERVAAGTVIGNITNGTSGSTIRLADPNEDRFRVVGTQLQTGPWLLDVGTVPVTLEEVISAGPQIITKQTTLNITVNRDAANWPVVVPTVWAAPTAQGTGDGSSAANAKAITGIPGTLAPGAIVGVRADLGSYNPSAAMAPSTSGTSGSHIKWVGVDATGKRTLANFNGGRYPYRKQTHDQEEVLTLFTNSDSSVTGINIFNVGALSYVDFEDLSFTDVQVCFNQAGGNPSNLTFKRMHCRNVQRLYEHQSTQGHTNCVWDGPVVILFSKAVIRCRGTTSNFTIQNFYFDAQRIDNDNWSSGSQIDDSCATGLIQNGTVKNCHNYQGALYANGDGFSTEELNPNMTFINVTSLGHTDAGLDLKTGATVTGGTLGDCKRNFKCWAGKTGNGKYTLNGVTFLPPIKRAGSGSACHININATAGTQPYPIEVRVIGDGATKGDLRLFGQANAQEIAFLDTSTVAIIQYINVQRDAVPVIANQGPGVRYMIAAAAPSGAITLTANTANLSDGSAAAIPIATNRDAAHGGVIIRSIGGADAAQFQINGSMGIGQSISAISPIAYTGTGADVKSLTVTLEDIVGNTLGPVPFTVNVIADTTDYRVLDVTFAGGDNTAGATDASPAAHALSYGSAAKIRTTIDPAGRLFVPFTANANTTGCVRSTADSADWDITGPWTLIASGVRMDTAATALKQTIVGRHNNTSASAIFRLMFDTAGHPAFEVFTSSGLAFTLTDPTVRSAGVDYDLKVTRKLISGTTYQWDLYVNGVSVANVQNTTIPNDATGGIGIGATTAARDYMQGYPKRVAIFKGTANGT